MITRRRLIVATYAGALAAPLASFAQPRPGKTYRIGWLSSSTAVSGATELEALRDGPRGLGYIESKNIIIESRWANGDAANLPALARSLVELKVDLICADASQAALAARQATTTIPIVFGRAAFPDQSGLVAGLARPGGNVTGVAFIGPEYGKRLELLREISPKLTRVALLYNDQNPASLLAVKETQRWAKQLKVALEPHGLQSRGALDKVFTAIVKSRAGGLMTTADPMVISFRKEIVEFAAAHKLPSIYPNQEFVEIGGLVSYGANFADMIRRSAIFVDKILKGAKPAGLPVEQPVKFNMTINLKTAKTLGIKIPPSIMLRADKVIE